MAKELNAPERMELWARKYKIREELLDGWVQALSGSRALLPPGCLDDHAAAACISQWMVFWMERNLGHSLGLGWPGRGWPGCSSLCVLEEMTSEAEGCHSPKIV